jgi:tetratricopeptide (TPR) repeat protein
MARRDGRSLTLVGSIWAVMTVAVALFYVVSRYRYPIVPVMLLFAGGTIASLSKPLAWRTSAAPFAMATIAAVLSYLPLTHATNVTFENTGAALTLEGHPLDAVPLLREAIAIDPADPRAHYDLGVALEHSGDADGAFSEYDAAVRIRPAFVEARDALGTSLRARGRAAEAAEHFAAAVQLSPGSSRAHLNYGVTLWELGRRDEALHEYEEAVRLQPEDSAAHNNLGVALVAIGRPSDAETQFRMAIDRNGGNFNAHANYGDLLSQIGRPDESVREYEQAARLAPDDLFTDLSLLRKLADAYASAGRITDARDTLKKAVLIAHTAHRDDLAEALANASRNWRN